MPGEPMTLVHLYLRDGSYTRTLCVKQGDSLPDVIAWNGLFFQRCADRAEYIECRMARVKSDTQERVA